MCLPFKVDLLVLKQNPASENAMLYPKKENLILRIGIIRNLFLILNVVPGTRQTAQAGGGRQRSASANLIPGSGGF